MKLSLMKKFDDLYWASYDEGALWKAVNNTLTDPKDLYEAVDYFVSHLKQSHTLPGNDFRKMLDIAENARKYKTASLKQYQYITLTMGCHWNEIEQTAEWSMI